ncbi:MAG: putative penicillin acylase [Pseudomonadota bacterium]
MGVRRRILKGLGWTAAGLGGLGIVAGIAAYSFLSASYPLLEGPKPLAGLTGPVTVERDAYGVATVIAADRGDMARALGFIHAQERFFQMDLLRRAAAGELSALLGKAALPVDRQRRLHRFRARGAALVAAATPEQRDMLTAYAEGVNAGLAALGARPFEYGILRQMPAAWRPEDTLLVTWAMFFDLQDDDGRQELFYQRAIADLGREWADFLYPLGTGFDAALDGTMLPQAPIPATPPTAPAPRQAALSPEPWDPVFTEPEMKPGSNNWAVGGALTAHGGAMVANDMHLGHGVPNIWYRARLVLTDGAGEILSDITGHSLPGTPNLVTGSNGRIAWAYTNSYIDTGDAVVVEPGAGDGTYRTPDGDRPFTRHGERICASDGACEDLVVEETVWGPVVATDAAGRKIAYRWVAHDVDAGAMSGLLDLERAGSVGEAVAIARRSGIPNNNFVVGDREGSIAWTLIGRIPRRVGHDGRLPVSWADGALGWDGYLSPEEIPLIADPADHRIWTANSRVVGGEDYARIGGDAYAHGARAHQIRELLAAKDRFGEEDLLAIQLDDRGTVLTRWQGLLRDRLAARAGAADADPRLTEMLAAVEDWGGRAVPDSVGYRIVRQFRWDLLRLTVNAYRHVPAGEAATARLIQPNTDEPVWRLLEARPQGLVPPGHATWDALVDAAIAAVLADMDKAVAGKVADYTWGGRNRPGVRHPLSAFVPGLSWLTDPADDPVPGDTYQPRAQGRGFGASERTVVSPGREADGIAHMPGSQSGHPLTPYYLKANAAWREGRPSPFLPGPAVWTLRLEPPSAP